MVYKFIFNLVELFIKEFDEYNIVLSLILGEIVCYWCLFVSNIVELFLKICEKDGVDFFSLIFMLCNVLVRVKFLEIYIVCILMVV